LGFGEAEKDGVVDAYELDQQSGEPAQYEVGTEHGHRAPAAGEGPQDAGDSEGGGGFIERGGMDRYVDGDHPVGKCHAPGQVSGFAVGAVAGEEAADPADAVRHGQRHRHCAGDYPQRQFVATGDDYDRESAADQSAVPGESGSAEHVPAEVLPVGHQVVDLCPDEAPQGRPQDQRVAPFLVVPDPLERPAEQVRADKCSEGFTHAIGLDLNAQE